MNGIMYLLIWWDFCAGLPEPIEKLGATVDGDEIESHGVPLPTAILVV